MKIKKITAFILCGFVAVSSLMGCGSIDKDAVVATLDGQDITLGFANFSARLQQANYDDFYVMYFGDKVWSSDLSGDGTTMEDSVKDSVIASVQEMYTLQNHMSDYNISLTEEEKTAISEAAASFMDANSAEALDALGATQPIVEEYLTLSTIQSKMYDAIIVDADTEVSDEEANMRGYSYVQISKTSYTDADGNAATYTEDELTDLAATAEEFATAAKKDFEGAATEYGYSVNTNTYAADDDTLNEAVKTAADALKEGEVSDLIDTDSAYYVLRLDSETDETATESNREAIVKQKQSDYYTEVLTGWEDASDWKFNKSVWKKVSFDNLFTSTLPSTETESVTEDVTESAN